MIDKSTAFLPQTSHIRADPSATCIDHVAEWMHSNRLQLNAAKTEVLWSTTSRRLYQLPQTLLRVSDDLVARTVALTCRPEPRHFHRR